MTAWITPRRSMKSSRGAFLMGGSKHSIELSERGPAFKSARLVCPEPWPQLRRSRARTRPRFRTRNGPHSRTRFCNWWKKASTGSDPAPHGYVAQHAWIDGRGRFLPIPRLASSLPCRDGTRTPAGGRDPAPRLRTGSGFRTGAGRTHSPHGWPTSCPQKTPTAASTRRHARMPSRRRRQTRPTSTSSSTSPLFK